MPLRALEQVQWIGGVVPPTGGWTVLKRLFDVAVSAVALVILLPLFVVLAILIRLDSPGPVFYRSYRAGRRNVPFQIIKFRSMVVNADKIGGDTASDQDRRITRLGRILRKIKFDEFPQFINVLRGQMSLVGPRPEVQKYVDQFTDEEQAILELRPGITDWASIWNADKGQVVSEAVDADLAYEQFLRPTKLRLQLMYVRNNNMAIDLKILASTAYKLVNKAWLPRELIPYGKPTVSSSNSLSAESGNPA